LIYCNLKNYDFFCWALVAHSYNPRYWEAKIKEDCGSMSVRAKKFTKSYLNWNKMGVVANVSYHSSPSMRRINRRILVCSGLDKK
jgi:hypothetical protein